MKNLLLITILLFSANASANFVHSFEDKARSKPLAVSTGIMIAMDWLQTLDIENHPGDEYTMPIHEKNPLLGRHPTRKAINLFFLSKLTLHTFLNWNGIKHSRITPYWNIFTASDTAYNVGANYELGLEIKF